jgi:hypothetical protein
MKSGHVLSALTLNENRESGAFADRLSTVKRRNPKKGFEDCSMRAFNGAYRQHPAAAFGPVFLMRHPICEDAGGMTNISRVSRIETVAGVSHHQCLPIGSARYGVKDGMLPDTVHRERPQASALADEVMPIRAGCKGILHGHTPLNIGRKRSNKSAIIL